MNRVGMCLLAQGRSKYSSDLSANTEGANGRNGSLNLIFVFTKSFISADLGSANMLRFPKARGPHSNLP